MKNREMFYEKLHYDKKKRKWAYKPRKFLIYTDKIQEKLYKEARKAATRIIKNYNSGKKEGRIVKALTFGSFLDREMGIYCRDYRNERYGSDIDVVCIVEPGFVAPKKWKNPRPGIYIVDEVEKYVPEIENWKKIPLHPINFIVFRSGKDNFSVMKNYVALDENYSRRKGYKFEIWYLDKKSFNKIKEMLK